MSQSIQRCPNCGAYVMSSDNICPRCDYPLNQPAPDDREFEAVAEIFDPNASPAGTAAGLVIPEFREAKELPKPRPDTTEDAAQADDVEADELSEDPFDVAESVEEAAQVEEWADDEPEEAGDERIPIVGGEFLDQTDEAEAEADESADLDAEARALLPTSRLPNALPVFRELLPTAQDDDAPVEVVEADVEEAPPDDLPEFSGKEAVYSEPEPGDGAPTWDEIRDELESVESVAEAAEPPDDSTPDEGRPPLFAPDVTQARPVERSAPISKEPLDVLSEMPTAQLAPGERPSSAARTMTRPLIERPPTAIPPAPYTPPPAPSPLPPASIAPPPTTYGYGAMQPVTPSPTAYLQQRVQDYRRGGYRLHLNGPYEASLSMGKSLGAAGWLLALISIIGAFWYLLVLLLSGFRRDIVDIVVENDGQVYEDGSGAAHVRQQRARVGRRWAMFGAAIFVVSLLLLIMLAVIAGIVLRDEQYQAALREAYPAITLFEEQFSPIEADPEDISTAKDGAVAFAIAAGIAAVGLWGGATLWVIGTIHARAYRTSVAPLPGWG